MMLDGIGLEIFQMSFVFMYFVEQSGCKNNIILIYGYQFEFAGIVAFQLYICAKKNYFMPFIEL